MKRDRRQTDGVLFLGSGENLYGVELEGKLRGKGMKG